MKVYFLKTIAFILALSMLVSVVAKNNKSYKKPDDSFIPYITGFTSGEVSASTRILIEFNTAIAIDTLTPEQLENAVHIEPKIKGSFKWVNGHTLQYIPLEHMKHHTNYEVSVKLNKFTKTDWSHRKFVFGFHTVEQRIVILPGSLNMYSIEDMDRYFVQGRISTTDDIDTSGLSSCFTAKQNNQSLPISFQKTNDRELIFVIDSIQRTAKDENISLHFNGKKIGIDHHETFKYELASFKEFSVSNIQVDNQESQKIIITFSDPLSLHQDLNGLIQIEKVTDWTYSITKNQVIIFLSNHEEGTYKITLLSGIKNAKEFPLPENYLQSLTFDPIPPQFNIIGEGNILPNSQGLFLPFESIYLQSVYVRVVKIYQNNVHQFMQINDLDGNDELSRVGKVVLEKKIQLDFAQPGDLKKWTHHGIDLSKLILPDPGAIYRISIKFDRSCTLYPCTESSDDNEDVDEETDEEGEEFSYIYDDSYDSYEPYNPSTNPCENRYYYGKAQSRNIIASNIGIIYKMDELKNAYVFTSDMVSSGVLPNTSIELYNYTKQLIGKGTTNASGMLTLHLKERPFLLVAKNGQHYGYMKVEEGYQNSLSKFDITGEELTKGFKGFIYGERGVWRPGDSIYLSFISGDYYQKLPDNYPVSFTFKDPDGKILFEKTIYPVAKNTYNIVVNTQKSAPTGHYQAMFKLGNQQFYKSISVESIKPNRIKINYTFPDTLLTDKTLKDSIRIKAQWLFGNVAQSLETNTICRISTITNPFPQHKGYIFSSPEVGLDEGEFTVAKGVLDKNGCTAFCPQFSTTFGNAMLKVNFITNIIEKSGNINTDNTSINFCPFKKLVGLNLQHENGDYLYTNTKNMLQLITTDPNGKIGGSGTLRIQIWKMQWSYWYASDGNDYPSYISGSKNNIYIDTTIQYSNGRYNFPMNIPDRDWGKYLIVVKDPGGHSCGQVVYFDTPYWKKGDSYDKENAKMLHFTADKSNYTTGEKINLNIPASSNGHALISIEKSTGVVQAFWTTLQSGNNKVEIIANEKMTPNIFVHVTLLQPHINTQNGLPIRMYGILPLYVENPATHLAPTITCKDEVRPEQPFTVSIKESKGNPMTYTLAIVDEGLLNITHFKTPQPWKYFYAKEALNVSTWDMYDQVIGAYAGKFDKLLSIGGDGSNDIDYTSKVNRFVPVVKFVGTYTLAEGQTKQHSITLPNYSGSVRIMVVANHAFSFGNAEKELIVKKPVMLLSNVPRVLSPQDEIMIPVNIFATDKSIKDVKIKIVGSEHFQFAEQEKWIHFNEPGDEVITFRAKIAAQCGVAHLKITANSGQEQASEAIEIAVRTPQPRVSEVVKWVIAPQATLNTAIAMNAIKGTEKLTLEVSRIPNLAIEKQLSYLIQYPHGCVEQTTSSVFPQLYLSTFMNLDAKQQKDIAKNIQDGINRLQSFQTGDGGFSYWPDEYAASEYGTNYAGHFLMEAKNQGYDVPEYLLKNWYNFQRDMAKNWSDHYNDNDIQAYRLYTLAVYGKPEMGAMNQLKEVALSDFAKWRLATAYYLAGYTDISKKMTASISLDIKKDDYSHYYGSLLRERAIQLEALATMSDPRKLNSFDRLLTEMYSRTSFNTQEAAFYLISLAKYYGTAAGNEYSFSYAFNQQPKEAVVSKRFLFTKSFEKQSVNATNQLVINNNSTKPLYISAIKSYISMKADTTHYNNGLYMQVSYCDIDGRPINPKQLKQGSVFKVTVAITNTTPQDLTDNVLEQYLPSGWEILYTQGVNYGVRHSDIRDDRIYTYYDLKAKETASFTYLLSASFAGKYLLPAVFTTSMYDAKISAKNKSGVCEVL
ncbi:MAG: hypothetical protein K1X55_13420 [Chitinophagales bacterium]|nr:hypothetical protein [Chitinophagales bacterium]